MAPKAKRDGQSSTIPPPPLFPEPPPHQRRPETRPAAATVAAAVEARPDAHLFIPVPFLEPVEDSSLEEEAMPSRRDEHRQEHPQKDNL